jgi:lipopolysaccharide transport system ATP-binding protein
MSNPIISVEGIGKAYRLGRAAVRHDMLRDALVSMVKSPFKRLKEFTEPGSDEDLYWALRDITFDVQQGEVVGIIGRNGAGKSTLLKILSRITEPTEGQVTLRGRVASLLEVGTGFHPELTGRENVYLNGAILGMTKIEIDQKFDEIVAFAEIEKFLETPVKRYSSGMYVRLAFAVAAYLEPEILIVDEVLAVGDAEFQKKCLGKMGEVTKTGRTVLFVSHNLAAVASLCSRSLLLDKGSLKVVGDTRSVIDLYGKSHDLRSEGAQVELSRPSKASLWMTRACLLYEGVPTSAIPLGAHVSLQIDYSADPPTRSPRFGFVITTSDGSKVLGANNRYQPSELLDSPLEQGTITCNLGQLPLTPGSYRVSLFLGDQSMDTHVELDAFAFSVAEKDIWGLGKLPPSDGAPLWWPTQFNLSRQTLASP